MVNMIWANKYTKYLRGDEIQIDSIDNQNLMQLK